MFRRAIALQLSAALSMALAGCDAPKHVDAPLTVEVPLASETFALPNGLRLVEQPDPRAATVAVRVRYYAGPKDDPSDQNGLAHVVQHLMMSSSRRTAPIDYGQRVHSLTGGAAFTNIDLDHTDFGVAVPPPSLAIALWLEADRMAFPFQPADTGEIRIQKDVVQNERRQAYDADPAANLRDVARSELFGAGHPYARTVQGVPNEIDSVSLEEARAFADQYYRPDNATLIVSGAFERATLRSLVWKYFGPIPPGHGLERRAFRPVTLPKSRTITIDTQTDVRNLVVGWIAPPPEGDGYAELGLAARALWERASYKLVVERHVTDQVRVLLEPGHLGSLFTITLKVTSGVALDDALTALDDQIAAVAQYGRTTAWEDFALVKVGYASARILALEQPAERSRRLIDEIERRRGADPLRAELTEVQAIRDADVGTAVAQFLRESPRVVVMARPPRDRGAQ